MIDKVHLVRVFLASPGDVAPERAAMSEVIDELNKLFGAIDPERRVRLELVRWETHARPAAGRPQAVINEQIGLYEVFVGLMWKRFGTPPGDPLQQAESGTEEEFNRAYDSWEKTGTPEILLYFSRAPYVIDSPAEGEQLLKVLRFRERLRSRLLTWDYASPQNFPANIRVHLAQVISKLVPRASLALANAAPAALGEPARQSVSRLYAEEPSLGDAWAQARELGLKYEQTRASMNSSPERTRLMELVMTEMRTLVPSVAPLLERLQLSAAPGQRLLAIAILQARPDVEGIDWLAKRFETEAPFLQYHAALALLAAARAGLNPLACQSAIETGMRALGADKAGTDRYSVLKTARDLITSTLKPIPIPAGGPERVLRGSYVEMVLQLQSGEAMVAVYERDGQRRGLVVNSQQRMTDLEREHGAKLTYLAVPKNLVPG